VETGLYIESSGKGVENKLRVGTQQLGRWSKRRGWENEIQNSE